MMKKKMMVMVGLSWLRNIWILLFLIGISSIDRSYAKIPVEVFGKPENYKYFLTLGAIFCRESHILKEWLHHHILEGVEHFYLIDNCNTPDDRKVLEPYIRNGRVSLSVDTAKHKQTEHYDKYILPIAKQESFWLIIVDLDEFMYAPYHDNIPALLRSDFKDCEGITAQMISFDSPYIQTPPSIVHSNILRHNYSTFSSEQCDKIAVLVKTIMRPTCVKKMGVHFSTYDVTCVESYWCNVGPACINKDISTVESALREKRLLLRINHYHFQSKEYYLKVKGTRGDALLAESDKLRGAKMYNDYNKPAIEDFTLSRRRFKNTKLP